MKSSGIFIGLLIGLLIAAYFTKPDQERIEDLVSDALQERFDEQLYQDTADDSGMVLAGKAFGSFFGGAIIKKVIQNDLQSQHYLFFAVVSVERADEESKTIGYAAFGQVFFNGGLEELMEEGVLRKSKLQD